MQQQLLQQQRLPSKMLLDAKLDRLEQFLETHSAELKTRESGTVKSVGPGIALVDGLPGVGSEELVRFPQGVVGMAFNLDPEAVGVVLLCRGLEQVLVRAGAPVRRTGRVLDVPVGEALLGRIVDALGRPLDGRGPIAAAERRPVESPAPAILARAPVCVPLQTGLKIIDALIPIGRGQRQLILGDRQTGKTTIALDTILNQKDQNVLCVYCAIGQRAAAVAKLVAELRAQDALEYCTVLVAAGQDPPGLQFIAPYAATALAEYFMDRGRDVLVVYDDLTRHAWAYRELSLLLRRPPGREAFPGDIFYIHSRLLERSTHLRAERGGGSLTSLPIIETEAQNVSAYLPTNLISITDGQIYLSPDLLQHGILPAVDAGRSVSRVGGKAQLPAYRTVAGDLRLAYSQFSELEVFSRFSTRMDPVTRQALDRGRHVREIFKQPQHRPVPAAEQIAVLLAVGAGLFDELPLEQSARVEALLRVELRNRMPEMCRQIEAGLPLDEADCKRLCDAMRAWLAPGPGGPAWKTSSP